MSNFHPAQLPPSSETIQSIVEMHEKFPPGFPHWPQVWTQIQEQAAAAHAVVESQESTEILPQASDTASDVADSSLIEQRRRHTLDDSDEAVATLCKQWKVEWENSTRPMPPPPPGPYPGKDEAISFIKKWAQDHSYGLVIGKSKRAGDGDWSKVILHCSHANRYKDGRRVPDEIRQRKRTSKKTNCKVSVRLGRRKFRNDWLLRVTNTSHNHEPDTDRILSCKPPEYPDLDAALYEWHVVELMNGETMHGARLKAKAANLFAEMPQFRNKPPPDLDREWLESYRIRYNLPTKSGARKLGLSGTGDPEAPRVPAVGHTREAIVFHSITQTFADKDESLLIKNVREAVKEYMSRYDASHDWDHILRVLSLCKKMMREESELMNGLNIDPKIVYLAAICHDLGDHKYAKPGENVDNQIAELLLSHGASGEVALKVQLIAKNVSFSNETKNARMVTAVLHQHPELGFVQDADRLDAIGAIGIGRTFVFTGAKMADRSMADTIEHFTDKLEKLETMMKTNAGRRMARERTERLQTFRRWWEEEYEVVD